MFYKNGYINLEIYSNNYLTKGFYNSIRRVYNFSPCFGEFGVQYFDVTQEPIAEGLILDLVGESGSEIGRECQRGCYLVGDGIRKIETGLSNTILTYVDATTELEVETVTDIDGYLIIPINGIAKLVINGHTFWCEEFVGNYIGATDGTYYQITPDCVFQKTDRLFGYADMFGYTIASGGKFFWDDELTVPIEDGTILVKMSGSNYCIGYSTDNEVYITADDFEYITDDEFSYII